MSGIHLTLKQTLKYKISSCDHFSWHSAPNVQFLGVGNAIKLSRMCAIRSVIYQPQVTVACWNYVWVGGPLYTIARAAHTRRTTLCTSNMETAYSYLLKHTGNSSNLLIQSGAVSCRVATFKSQALAAILWHLNDKARGSQSPVCHLFQSILFAHNA